MSLKLAVLGLQFLVLPSLIAGSFVKYGKVNFTTASPHNVYCRTVSFPQSFSGTGKVRVLASVGHGEKASGIHDSAVVWTKQVTARSFGLCMMESGEGMNGSAIVNWIAFQTTPTVLGGTASVGLFASSTKCIRINFSERFSKVPEILATVRHSSSSRPQDALNLWLEDVHADYFRVCLREVKTFDGKHKNIEVVRLASYLSKFQ